MTAIAAVMVLVMVAGCWTVVAPVPAVSVTPSAAVVSAAAAAAASSWSSMLVSGTGVPEPLVSTMGSGEVWDPEADGSGSFLTSSM